jgi:ribosome-associated protein
MYGVAGPTMSALPSITHVATTESEGDGPFGRHVQRLFVLPGAAQRARTRMIGRVPGDLHVHGSVVIPEAELSWRFSRSSGPGGQGVNTTDSRVELLFDVARTTALGPTLRARALDRLSGRLVDGVLSVTASEHRSQLRNREAAERRLVAELAAAIQPPARPRRPTTATRASVERRLAAKKHRAEIKRMRRPD